MIEFLNNWYLVYQLFLLLMENLKLHFDHYHHYLQIQTIEYYHQYQLKLWMLNPMFLFSMHICLY